MSLPVTQDSVGLPYSGGPLDRASSHRADPSWIAALLDDASRTRLIPLWQDQCLVSGDPPVPVMSTDPDGQAALCEVATPVFLGLG